MQSVELTFKPIGAHSSGAVISSAVTLTKPAGASLLMMQTITQNVRFTLDGTAPQAAVGFQIRAGDPPIVIPIAADTVVKVIQEAATAVLQYQFGQATE